MNPPRDLLELAALKAAKYKLDPVLVASMVDLESGWNTHALRWEQRFYSNYVEGRELRVFPPCSLGTEGIARATSWGLLQVMGQVARERGFTGAYLSTLCVPEVGLELGCRHLAWLRDRYLEPQDYVAAYNAGSPGSDAGVIYYGRVTSRYESARRAIAELS